MTAEDAFAAALAAEHAAIFGYGVAGAHLVGPARRNARDAESAHRARRDALLLRLTSPTPTAVPAEPAYALPFPVTDPPSALRLAQHLEERTAAIWRSALPETAGPDRRIALDALVDCALRASRWRRLAGQSPTVPFPGT